jgi:hypothetical protein
MASSMRFNSDPRRPFHFLARGTTSGFILLFATFLHFTHVTCWMFVS